MTPTKTHSNMRFSKEEKEALFELLDIMTDRCPSINIDRFTTPHYNEIFWGMFRKLRVELKGY